MDVTQYPEVNQLLKILLTRMQHILNKKLLGLYLEGSLIHGDFDLKNSDVDLVAILSSDLDNKEFDNLRKMHNNFINEHKEWDDRIEVCYVSQNLINTVKTNKSEMVVISPGEPFHKTKSQKEWLMNWYLTREKSVILFGPSPKNLIIPISKEEFIQSVKDHVQLWEEWIRSLRHNRYSQAYAILTMCRALYILKNGDQVSKKQAVHWVQKVLPEWSEVIKDALVWKNSGRDEGVDNTNYPNTLKFVNFVRNKILSD